MLTTIPSAAAIAVPLSSRCLPMMQRVFSYERIQQIAAPLFKIGSSLYLSSFGTIEIFQSLKTTPQKKEALKTEVLAKAQLSSSAYYLDEHGKLMLGSGCCYLLDMLQDFGVVTCGKLVHLFSTAGSVLFLCANVYAIEENIRLYQEIESTDWTKTNIDAQELRWLKSSAICGMMSNIGYIAATTALLFNGATAITLLVALFSCFAGGVKILCDLCHYAMQEKSLPL